MVRTGRRPGGTDTQAEILAAARRQFAKNGYRGATIRGIAGDAGVDPALVHHYFGSKRALFVETIELPFDPAAVVAVAQACEPEKVGERILRTLLGLWGAEPVHSLMQSVLRSALTDPEQLDLLREFMLETVLLPIATQVAPDRAELRATLLASQAVGLAMVRYIARIEPLASADDDTVVAAVAPTLQRYLTGPLDT
jgi:AcrR family transcriptional regulator